MLSRSIPILAAAAFIPSLAVASTASTPAYNLSTVYGLGGNLNLPSAINNSGQVAVSSTYFGQEASPHAAFYNGYQLISLESAVGDNNYSLANGVNNAGVVVGASSAGPTSTLQAFSYDSHTGVATPLGTLGGTYLGGYSNAAGINNLGTIVGSSYVSNTTYQEHAFIYNPNTQSMSDIGTLDSDAVSAARAVNDDGLVAGVSVTNVGDMSQRTFLYDSNTSSMTNVSAQINTSLSNSGDLYSSRQLLSDSPTAISNFDNVVGIATVGTPGNLATAVNYAYVYYPSIGYAAILNNSLGGISTTANGINNNGQIVGASYDGSANHAYVYDPYSQQMTDLNTVVNVPAGLTINDARSINNSGQILVTASNSDGTYTATFVLSPTSGSSSAVSSDIYGNPVVISVNGGSSSPGGVVATFNISDGTFSANYIPESAVDLSAITAPLPFTAPGTGGQVQAWFLNFDGALNDYYIPLSFTYDPSLLPAGTDPADLRIYHFENGQWILPDNEVVDTVNHTISFQSQGFSPFALGVVSVPEPASFSLLVLAATPLLRRRRRA